MKLIKIFTVKTGKDHPYLFEIEESKGYYIVNLLAEASVKEPITNKIVE